LLLTDKAWSIHDVNVREASLPMEERQSPLSAMARSMGLLLCTTIVLIAAGQHKATSQQKSLAADKQTWMDQCVGNNPSLSTSQCALWVSRKEFVHKTACPDRDASTACQSFQELIKADDSDLLLDLAQRERVYACFRPQQDVFLEIYFSDPSNGVWQENGPEPRAGALPGGAEVRYYKDGIASEGMSFHDDGGWKYPLAAGELNASTPMATNGPAIFEGKYVSIKGSRLEASQTYKDESGVQIHHDVVLQLSTGRFTESYDVLPAGNTIDTYSGRCLVLPTTIM
jgi:hypothetical protein